MIVGFTGHRPSKLPYKYIENNPFNNWLILEFEKILNKHKPEKIITGMALGVDQIAATVAIKLNIDFVAAIPFVGQENVWPEKSKKEYQKLLEKARQKIIVCEGSYSSQKMQIRNQYIVDNSDILVAVFDGTAGGTKNCVEYAKSKNKMILTINPKTFKE